MSATIGIKDSTFVIFGSGHDYTRIDSGEGEKIFFSHPKVPLNSVNYAGQYYFLVPDEDGEVFDAVKDDIAHCTFTPAIGTTFDTEGTTTVKVKYRREYIHDEETILVEKELTQTVEVVDHGAIVYTPPATDHNIYDVYADGYLFWRPRNTSEVVYRPYFEYHNGKVKASSNIPWRVTGLGTDGEIFKTFLHPDTTCDLSELATADLSNVTEIHHLLESKQTTDVVDLTPIGEWNVSTVTDLSELFYINDGVDTTPLSKWDVSNVTTMYRAFSICSGNLSGLADWDVSSVVNFQECFMNYAHHSDSDKFFTNLDFLAKWNTESAENMSYMFASNISLTDTSGLTNWNVSNVQTMSMMFSECIASNDLSPLANWDVSSCEDFSDMFGGFWIRDLSPLADWDMSSALHTDRMFVCILELQDVSALAGWDMSNVESAEDMFYAHRTISSDYSYYTLSNNYFEGAWFFTDTYIGIWSDPYSVPPYLQRDASGVSGWNITAGLGVFGTFGDWRHEGWDWQNVPAWN